MNELSNEILYEIISLVYDEYDIKFQKLCLVNKRFKSNVEKFVKILKTRVGCIKFNTYTLRMEWVTAFPRDSYIAFRKECNSIYEKYGYWIAFSDIPFCKEFEPIWENYSKNYFWDYYFICVPYLEMYFAEENVDSEEQWRFTNKYYFMCTKLPYRKIRSLLIVKGMLHRNFF